MGAFEKVTGNLDVILESDPDRKIEMAQALLKTPELEREFPKYELELAEATLKRDLQEIKSIRATPDVEEGRGYAAVELVYRQSKRTHSQANASYGVFFVRPAHSQGAEIIFNGTSRYSNSMDAQITLPTKDTVLALIELLQRVVAKQ